MNHKSKTVEFSAHLSRSKMGRYLENQLPMKEINEVELHLKYCGQCSEGILLYIQTENPQHYKTYYKRLKGHLKSKEAAKKRKLTNTHLKMLRATAAVILLFIFSFFAIDTVINKKMMSQEQPKAQIQTKKEVNLKKATTSPTKEQKTNENSQPEVIGYNSKPALQNQVASKESSREKATSKTAPERISSTSNQASTKKPSVIQKEVLSAKETNSNQLSHQATAPSPQDENEVNNEESTAKKSFPTLERLDVRKTTGPSDTEIQTPTIPIPNETN